MKVIVAGSRDFTDYSLVKSTLDALRESMPDTEIEIVHGDARGADKLGERYAKEHGLKFSAHPADWDRHGRSAGYRRNEDMAKISQALVAFWDGLSKGTKHMIDLAKQYKLKVKVVLYKSI